MFTLNYKQWLEQLRRMPLTERHSTTIYGSSGEPVEYGPFVEEKSWPDFRAMIEAYERQGLLYLSAPLKTPTQSVAALAALGGSPFTFHLTGPGSRGAPADPFPIYAPTEEDLAPNRWPAIAAFAYVRFFSTGMPVGMRDAAAPPLKPVDWEAYIHEHLPQLFPKMVIPQDRTLRVAFLGAILRNGYRVSEPLKRPLFWWIDATWKTPAWRRMIAILAVLRHEEQHPSERWPRDPEFLAEIAGTVAEFIDTGNVTDQAKTATHMRDLTRKYWEHHGDFAATLDSGGLTFLGSGGRG